MNCLQQQACFDNFLKEFNTERPHEALAMKVPATSIAPLQGLGRPEVEAPFHDRMPWSPPAAASACIARRSNIPTIMQVKGWA
jgi:hypothetical protein